MLAVTFDNRLDYNKDNSHGRQIEFHGIDVFEFDHEGKILLLKAYWDAAPVMETLAAASLDQE